MCGPQRLQGLGQGLGLVGVVDEGGGACRVAGHQLHPARRGAQAGQERQDRLDRGSARQHQPSGSQQIAGLKAADQADGEAMAAAQQLELELHAVRGGRAAHQPERLRPLAIVEDLELTVDREPGEVGELRRRPR